MKICLFSRPDAGRTREELSGLLGLLDQYLPGWYASTDFARAAAAAGIAVPAEKLLRTMPGGDAVAISYGGDGTFLECVRTVGSTGTPILGVNSGRLGFLANVPVDGMEKAFQDIAAGRFTVERRALLHAEGDFGEQPPYPYAFNEFSIQRGPGGMVAVETYVDGEMVATYWGDGAMVSTPSGSTAYSLSAGGPVLAPGCDCFVISPIAPHNLTMRPVVIPGGSTVVMKVRERYSKPYATLDNRTIEVADGATFTLSKAKNFINLVRLQNISFYDTLRNKMLWGVDKREER